MSTLEAAPFLDRLWVAGYALVAYLWQMVWPFDLVPFYPYPKSIQWFSVQYLGAALLIREKPLLYSGRSSESEFWNRYRRDSWRHS